MSRSDAFVSKTAVIDESVEFGAFCVIEDDVRIGSGTQIGHHVVIRAGSIIGDNVRIGDHSVVGVQPLRAANSAVTGHTAPPPAHVGDHVLIGSHVVLYAGCTVGKQVLVADFASVRENVSIGERTIVGRGVAIENKCTIGRSCKLETNAYITAFSTLEDFVFVAPGVLTSNDNFAGRSERRFEHFGGVTVRRGGRLGVGAVILPGVEIDGDGFAAAGSVVTRDVPQGRIVVGVPAVNSREVDDEQKLENQNWDLTGSGNS